MMIIIIIALTMVIEYYQNINDFLCLVSISTIQCKQFIALPHIVIKHSEQSSSAFVLLPQRCKSFISTRISSIINIWKTFNKNNFTTRKSKIKNEYTPKYRHVTAVSKNPNLDAIIRVNFCNLIFNKKKKIEKNCVQQQYYQASFQTYSPKHFHLQKLLHFFYLSDLDQS